MRLPESHPQRIELNDEVHARPPEALSAPLRLSYLALLSDGSPREAEWRAVADLAARFNVEPPAAGANHHSADLGPFRLKWEQHTEFTRYTFIAQGVEGDDPFARPAIASAPEDWVAGLPGRVMVAINAALLRDGDTAFDPEAVGVRLFSGNALIGSVTGGAAASAFTDFRIHPDGFGRLLVLDRGMARRQAGRMIQRLLEIDTYRVMALLAFPVARRLAPILTGYERELARITTALASGGDPDEPALLDRLTRLEAEIDSREADNHYRFSAAAAYYELVQRRIAELREERIQGLSTFEEFTERRLAPAMNTCRAVAARLESLSERVARATQLLSTRVDLARERQNQAVLESMNRRAKQQLRLQQTVEGLSIAAITYYLVGLVGYAAKGVAAAGLKINPDLAMGVSIPLVALVAALGLRRVRRKIER